MARKTKEDTLKTIVAILDAAEASFVEKGVANTTIADIAERAEVSKGAVYGHYKDKMSICVAVCERGISIAHEIGNRAHEGAQLDRLYDWCMEYFRLMNESNSVKNVMDIMYCKCEQSPEYEPIQMIRAEWERRAWKISGDILKKAAHDEETAAGIDLELCNLYLHSLLEGIVITLLYTKKFKTSYRAKVGTMLLTGIATFRDPKAFR